MSELEAWQWCKKQPGLEIYIGKDFVRLSHPSKSKRKCRGAYLHEVVVDSRLEQAVARLQTLLGV